MNYYIRLGDSTEIGGPFSIEAINNRIQSGEIGKDLPWLATSDLGESLDTIRKAPAGDWIWLCDLAGVAGLQRPTASRKVIVGVDQTRFAVERLVFVIFAVILAAISFSSAAKKDNENGVLLPWEQGATGWNLLALIMGFLLFGYAALTFLVRAPIWRQRFIAAAADESPQDVPEFSFRLLLREFLVAGGITLGAFVVWFAYWTIRTGGQAWK